MIRGFNLLLGHPSRSITESLERASNLADPVLVLYSFRLPAVQFNTLFYTLTMDLIAVDVKDRVWVLQRVGDFYAKAYSFDELMEFEHLERVSQSSRRERETSANHTACS